MKYIICLSRLTVKFISLPLTTLWLLSGCSQSPQETADAIYTNGSIYTVNEAQPWAEAVAIKDGKFVLVGSDSEVGALAGEGTKVVDLQAKFAMPGIFDLHAHPFITPWYGSMNLSLQNPGDADAILAEIKQYAEANPDKEWIIGGQWLAGVFPDNNPTKTMLDEIIQDRPVAMLDQTGHAFWLNSKALELAGITADTETSNLIVIRKDPKTGEPTGKVEEQAMQLVERVIPQAIGEEYMAPVAEILDMFASYGITSMQTAEGHRAPLDGVKLLESQGNLNQRLFVSWDWKTTLNLAYTLEDIESQIKNRNIYETELVRPNYVKIFADGGPNSNSSLLLEPYEGNPEFYGDANMTTEDFATAFTMFDIWGVGVHIHAIGDGTIRRVMDALEMMKEKNGDTGVRHKVAHNMMISAEDLARVAVMKDVNIDFSPPIWYPHEGAIATFQPPMGEDRYSKIYPVKTALDQQGLHVGQGADWLTANPTPDPFISIEGMVTRKNPFDPKMTGTLGAEQAISLEQAIAICTIEGAWVLGVEEELGSIEKGKYADLIILNQNLFEIPEDEIFGTQVLHTIIGGKEVYSVE